MGTDPMAHPNIAYQRGARPPSRPPYGLAQPRPLPIDSLLRMPPDPEPEPEEEDTTDISDDLEEE